MNEQQDIGNNQCLRKTVSFQRICGCNTIEMFEGTEEESKAYIARETAERCYWCEVDFLNIAAIENSKLKGFVKLIGLKKRVARALNIRDSVDMDLPFDHQIFMDDTLQPFIEALLDFRKRLANIPDAEWWISHKRSFENKSLLELTEKARSKSEDNKIIIRNINKLAVYSNEW